MKRANEVVRIQAIIEKLRVLAEIRVVRAIDSHCWTIHFSAKLVFFCFNSGLVYLYILGIVKEGSSSKKEHRHHEN